MISKKFKAWIFKYFKEEIMTAYGHSFNPIFSVRDIIFVEEAYTIEKLLDKRFIEDNYDSPEDERNYFDAQVRARNRLANTAADLIEHKVIEDPYNGIRFMHSSIVVGVKTENNSKIEEEENHD